MVKISYKASLVGRFAGFCLRDHLVVSLDLLYEELYHVVHLLCDLLDAVVVL